MISTQTKLHIEVCSGNNTIWKKFNHFPFILRSIYKNLPFKIVHSTKHDFFDMKHDLKFLIIIVYL